ncbi:uncharacterized protein LOC115634034 isoform X2 [Scaptodrosophila lebanonensis]|uniref:Uncharacterized protein LOC115634034 isoform X2 n=1 Tax=Drosophila lebanonensis TaxID=7225 RepID=A0A6J2UG53_DROLE|nr:uncharacterized protein LOC115634034 isoform X2 [Scaptodrosophila lebanonensis]
MFSSQQLLLLGLMLCFGLVCGDEAPETMPDVIKEDVISDRFENTTQKVIRVNPLDLPSKKDHTGNSMNSAVIQKMKQQKQLQFIFDQASSRNNNLGLASQALPVEVTPGAYPIYYVVAKTNGRFGKFPIKAFGSPAAFNKYLLKSKAEPIPRAQRYERR